MPGLYFYKLMSIHLALRVSLRTTRAECATHWRSDKVRRLPLDGLQARLPGFVEARH